MAARLLVLRASLRHGWRGLLAIALLIGLAGCAVLTGMAAVRRTESAFDRMRDSTEAWDLLVNPDAGIESGLDQEAVAALPEVAEVGRYDGVLVGPARIEEAAEVDVGPMAVASSDGTVGYELARWQIQDGRMPRADAADEVLLSPQAAEYLGLDVGDEYAVRLFTFEDLMSLETADTADELVTAYNDPELGERIPLHVVGIGVAIDELVVDEGFADGTVVLTPAFWEEHDQPTVGWFGFAVRLAEGVSPDQARAAISALVPEETLAFQTADALADQVDRAVRPEAQAIRLFTAVALLVTVVIVGQAVSRRIQLDAASDAPLRALGVTRAERAGLAVARIGVAGLVGAVLAVAIAVAASPVAPLGAVRPAEPDPGIRVDPLVLSLGAVAIVVVSLAVAVWPALRVARARERERARPGVVSSALVRWGLRPSTVMGARFALEPGPTSVPTRSTLVGAATSVVLVTATVTFAASLDHFVGTPELYGASWSEVINVDSFADRPVRQRPAFEQLQADDRVEALSMVVPGQVTLDGTAVPAFALGDSSRPVRPSLVEGRPPAAEDEVVLGARTLEDLGVGVGDEVPATAPDGTEGRLLVVGRSVMPAVAAYSGSDKTTLGEGAVLTSQGLSAWSPRFAPIGVAVRLQEGVDVDDVVADLEVEDWQYVAVLDTGEPSDVSSLERVRSTPVILSGLLATLIALTVAHALMAAVRARRRELAVLRTFGFNRRQVLGTVATQASVIALVAVLVGIPVGIATGRLAWSRVVDDLGAILDLVTPALGLALVAGFVLVVANLVGLVPGLRAAAAHPADTLRTE